MLRTDDGETDGRASKPKCFCFPAFYLKGFNYGICDLDIDLLEWVKSTLRL